MTEEQKLEEDEKAKKLKEEEENLATDLESLNSRL
jgi:hypothetical protein